MIRLLNKWKSVVWKRFEFSCDKGAVRSCVSHDVTSDTVANTVRNKSFLARYIEFYKVTADHSCKISAQRLVQSILLAEAPAYVGLYYSYLAPINAERLSYYSADYMRNLGRRYNGDFSGFLFCIADMIFDMTMLDCGSIIPVIKLDNKVSLLKEKSGTSPILLLDDVFSELDIKVQNNLLNLKIIYYHHNSFY